MSDMIALVKYETQTFTEEQEQAINKRNDAIAEHFIVMGIDPDFTENVWELVDKIVTEQILNNYDDDSGCLHNYNDNICTTCGAVWKEER